LKFIPRPWQIPIIKHVAMNRRSNIWADMGSGKTSAVLSALEILQMAGSNFFPILIIAPLRVARDVWPDEVKQWDHLKHFKVAVIHGNMIDRRRAIHSKADIYTINYENVPWLVEEWGEKWPYLTIIADESTRLKGFRLRVGTKRAAALAQIARKTQRWVNLTGTPSPNGLKDLWGQNWFVDFGERLGRTWTAFKTRWFDFDQYSMETKPKPFAQDQIQKAMQDITLTIQLKDYIDLKEPVDVPVPVKLVTADRKKYRQLEKEMFVALSADIELTAVSAAARSTKCLQFCAGAAYYEGNLWAEIHNLKLDALESIVEETAGANLLVSYWWQHDLTRLKKRFPHARELETKQDEDDWNAGKISMLLCHPKSAGHGLNLQHGGHRVVFFSDWWDFEVHSQIIQRIGPARQMQSGYDRPVYLYQIYVENTVDELVVERHKSKASVQELLMAAMKKGRSE
jgi:SNF2 family DNA or RNA helicase